MVAGVAEVGVGLTRLALGPHAEPQAAAVTALLEREPRPQQSQHCWREKCRHCPARPLRAFRMACEPVGLTLDPQALGRG